MLFLTEIAKDVSCSSSKATYLLKNAFAPEESENLVLLLRSRVFSLIIDESTDIGEVQHLVLIARVFEPKRNEILDLFITMLEVNDGTALGLYKLVKTFFKENEIPLVNIIGFASDNCSTMTGKHNGFVKHLKDDVPGVYTLGCICHSIQLCASKACEQLPSDVERLTRNVCNYVSGSAKRLRELKEFQEFTQTKHLKILKLAETRWLSHEAVISRILNQWEALVLFFKDQALSEGIKDAKGILVAMQNPVFRGYFFFLNFILPIVKKINLLFQSQHVMIHNLLSEISKEFNVICKCFLRKEYLTNRAAADIDVTNSQNFCALQDVYLGARFENLESELNSSELVAIRTSCRNYFVTLCSEIKQRINFNDPVLKAISLVDPRTALSGDVQSLVPLAKHFPTLAPEEKLELLNEEWRRLPLYQNELNAHLKAKYPDPVAFWVDVKNLKHLSTTDPVFRVLPTTLLDILVLPHSSAAAERIFSIVNNIKIKNRNRMSTNLLNALIHSKEHLRRSSETCYEFQPSSSLLKRAATAYLEKTAEAADENDLFLF